MKKKGHPSIIELVQSNFTIGDEIPLLRGFPLIYEGIVPFNGQRSPELDGTPVICVSSTKPETKLIRIPIFPDILALMIEKWRAHLTDLRPECFEKLGLYEKFEELGLPNMHRDESYYAAVARECIKRFQIKPFDQAS